MSQNIEKFKIKRLMKLLSSYKGNGTSMISLMIPPKTQLCQINKMLTVEMGTATNIKSRVNRLSVLAAIASTQAKLKTYSTTPHNGLIIFCGQALVDGRTKKLNIDFEPFAPVSKKLYICDDHFHTDTLTELFEDHDAYGFVIIDGNGVSLYRVVGNTIHKHSRFDVSLTSKTRRGGQSALRFARNRDIQKQHFVRRATELCKQYFIGSDNAVNVKGLVLAGSADFKHKLAKSSLLDPRLKKFILQIVDISYGDDAGLQEALQQAKSTIAETKLAQETNIIEAFFNELSQNTRKFAYGPRNIMDCLENGSVEHLIVYENLSLTRYTLSTGDIVVQQKELESTSDVVVQSRELFIDYITEHYTKYGCELHIISNKTSMSSQIVEGFGGLCAILRWQYEPDAYREHSESDGEESDTCLDFENNFV